MDIDCTIPIGNITGYAINATLEDLYSPLFRLSSEVSQDLLNRTRKGIIVSAGKQIEEEVCKVIEQSIPTFLTIYGLKIKIVNSAKGNLVHVTKSDSSSPKTLVDLKEDYASADLPDGLMGFKFDSAFNISSSFTVGDIFETTSNSLMLSCRISFIRAVIGDLCFQIGIYSEKEDMLDRLDRHFENPTGANQSD